MSDNHIENAMLRAHGKWHMILLAAGVDPLHLGGRQGPCPMCGGSDRFTYDNRCGRGDYICRQCGAGDGITLLRRFCGWSFREAFQHIEKVAGRESYEIPVSLLRPAPPRQTTSEQYWAMAKLWGRGVTTKLGDPVAGYLANRSIGLSPRVENLRTMVSQDGKRTEMLARVQNVAGEAVQLHRTVIEEGRCTTRRLMPGAHPAGSAVRLYSPAKRLGIAEGIENALSAACMFQIPVWAALTAGRLAKFEPPQYVENLEIFADNDEHGVGQGAARDLAKRMVASGIEAKIHLPPDHDCDWNVLLGAAMNGASEHRTQ